MANITALFWDVGGVLGTNGWDRYARADAVTRFGLDGTEFERRHQDVVNEFETGRLTLDDYLALVVFNAPRQFHPGDFKDFMFGRSQPYDEALALARSIAGEGSVLMAVLSNESREINDYRVERFGMRNVFSAFFSSCYVGLRKPDAVIYRLALDVTQQAPAQCLMIDDRQENLETAATLDMQTLLHDGSVEVLRQKLELLGVSIGPKK
ncbi:MAG TPA: HAD family phosphatase [Dehalococcoidia bacterium]